MINNLSKLNLKVADIVSIFTFCAYSGSVSENKKMFFTGPALNRILPILSKYFYVSEYTKQVEILGLSSLAHKIYITCSPLIRQAIKRGWQFRKKDPNKIPDDILSNLELFKIALSIILDCRGYLSFNKGDIAKKVRLTVSSTVNEDLQRLKKNLELHQLPGSIKTSFMKKVSNKTQCELQWNGKNVYTILDFIGWDLKRPWNVKMMKYLKENREARLLPKGRFL